MVPVVDIKRGDDAEPAFKCFTCRAVYSIGLDVYHQMKDALKEAVELINKENDA